MTSSSNFSSGLDAATIEGLRSLQDESDPHFLANYLKLFIDPIPLRLMAIETAVQTQDSPLLQSETHALKASCGNTGALKMASLCGELEKMAKAKVITPDAPTLVKELHAEFAVIKAEIKKLT